MLLAFPYPTRTLIKSSSRNILSNESVHTALFNRQGHGFSSAVHSDMLWPRRHENNRRFKKNLCQYLKVDLNQPRKGEILK